MSVVRVIEVIATSDQSYEDAIQKAVADAAKTLRNIRSVYIKEFNAKVQNDKVVSYGINAKISFELDEAERDSKRQGQP
ncbi:MAG: dodecin family protein [Hymenobacteraceae bacterium]|nr:dodecin family protein [Hymenobacteraceae bacterium]